MFSPDGKGRLDCDATQNSETFLKQPPVSEFLYQYLHRLERIVFEKGIKGKHNASVYI